MNTSFIGDLALLGIFFILLLCAIADNINL